MATPVTSAQWVITFQRSSVTDQRRFSITIANTVPKSTIVALARELEALGYEHIDMTFAVVLP